MSRQEYLKNVEKRLYAVCGNDGLITHNRKLIPGGKPALGGKVPDIRKLAKEVAKECSMPDAVVDYKLFMEYFPEDYLEEELLKAFVIGYVKDDVNAVLECAAGFVPKIHDWCVCDGFCQTFTIARKHRKEVFEWVCQYIDSDKEFEQRVVAVLLMSHFLVDDYYERVLKIMKCLKHDGYYTKMGVAWCVATAYAKYREATLEFLSDNELDDWTFNKAIQKMIESYRVPEEDKGMLRRMKR
ncbi:MAG: DNA alkylation repair protein [Lachnospira sp.]|nr:DNA alkylation repair protein [Lachnospira sp.]